MRERMIALSILLMTAPAVAQAAEDQADPKAEVHSDAAVELRRLQTLLEKIRRDCPDVGVDQACTPDSGPKDSAP